MSDNKQARDAQPVKRSIGRLALWGAAGVGALVLLLLLLWGGMAYRSLFRPVPLANPQIVRIQRGTSFAYVARSLHRRGIISNPWAFRGYAAAHGLADKLKVGDYLISGDMSPVQVLDLLVSGRGRMYELTIPEGKWASEIAREVAKQWPQAGRDFPALVNQPKQWLATMPFLQGVTSLEGFLFPDTYFFPVDASAELIITRMLERFKTTSWAAYQGNPPAHGLSLYQVLILASLVEGEAKRDHERATIAGVYMNRLRTPGWTLDCDATLIYARQQRVARLLNSDKRIESRYNSYRYRGLPPGPINNPGLKSFEAALRPAAVDYYFYVARGDGSHVFARTLAEQSANIQRYRGK